MEFKNRKKEQKTGQAKQNPIRTFLRAHFLLSKRVTFWYPCLFYCFVLGVTLVYNDQKIIEKSRKLQTLDDAYKMEVGRLEKNNQFIPYPVRQNIENSMEAKSFIKNGKRYYITMKNKEQE
ncbi:MAG: hypothetical protein LBK03_05000 [Bacteroidales bacterium]|jgi:hypothetical protein|nr:hypothetical protein [Bacteroidales bacterium]